jgi:hypothetical protein
MSAAIDVRLVNLDRMLRALKDSDEIAYKEIVKAMRRVAASVKAEAKKRIPSEAATNWGAWTRSRDGADLDFDGSRIAAKITLKQRNFRRAGAMGVAYQVQSMDPAGAAWSLMGKGNRVTTTQGAKLVQAVNDNSPIQHWRGSGKQGPRGLVEAYYAAKPEGTDEEIARKIADALERAMN